MDWDDNSYPIVFLKERNSGFLHGKFWATIPADHVFLDTLTPFPFEPDLEYSSFATMVQQDFITIQIGDAVAGPSDTKMPVSYPELHSGSDRILVGPNPASQITTIQVAIENPLFGRD